MRLLEVLVTTCRKSLFLLEKSARKVAVFDSVVEPRANPNFQRLVPLHQLRGQLWRRMFGEVELEAVKAIIAVPHQLLRLG